MSSELTAAEGGLRFANPPYSSWQAHLAAHIGPYRSVTNDGFGCRLVDASIA